ncbi:MAG: recombinase RecT [Negativicutes bacterium]|nr:recombinase RecT [Negativicutes bacterium]
MTATNGNQALRQKAQTNAPAPVQKKGKTIADYLNDMLPEISKAVPKHVTPERIARIALTAVRINPELLECTRDSLLAGVMTSAQLGLEPNTPLGQAYLIPYSRSIKTDAGWQKIKEVQFQLGYQGILDLAYRTGEYKDIYVEEVYQQDQFEYGLGLERHLIHRPSEEEDRGSLTRIYAVYHTKNGGYDFKVWSVGRIMAHAKKYSQTWNAEKQQFNGGDKNPWVANFAGMGRKTVLKDLLRYAPKSIEFAKILDSDETIKKEIAPDMSEVDAVDIDYSVPVTAPDATEQDTGTEDPNGSEGPAGSASEAAEESTLERHRRLTKNL